MASKLALEKFNDLNPTTTSNSKDVLSKSFVISRTDTVSATKAVLPNAAYLIHAVVANLGGAASDAATTAVINLFGGAGATAIGTSNVKAAIAPSGLNLINTDVAAAAAPLDQIINAAYAETGTASTTGGPWLVTVNYVV